MWVQRQVLGGRAATAMQQLIAFVIFNWLRLAMHEALAGAGCCRSSPLWREQVDEARAPVECSSCLANAAETCSQHSRTFTKLGLTWDLPVRRVEVFGSMYGK